MEYGLVGKKLEHSFSTQIHEMLFDYHYILLEKSPQEFVQFIKSRQFQGLNITIPYKEAATGLCDVVSDNVGRIGALNTIVNKNGLLYGYNTDYDGLRFLLCHHRVLVEGKTVVILGSGGTAKTARILCEDLGAAKIYCCSRKAEKDFINYTELDEIEFDILINTTPVGMYPDNGNTPLLNPEILHNKTVIDVIFNPLTTKLMQDAVKQGGIAIGGLLMLVAQAAKAGEYFGQKELSETEILDCYQMLRNNLENVVLIGMPCSGKTTVGRQLVQESGKEFIDIDEILAKRSGKSIKKIFIENGEEHFRKLEKDIIREYAAMQSLVIATGGGAVLDQDNIDALKENGRIVLVERSFDLLEIDDERPLLKNQLQYRELLEKRLPLYAAAKDFSISNNGSIEETVKKILEVWQ